MLFAVSIFLTDETIHPAELAPMVEERGLEALLVTEHTHIPASRRTPYPAGGDLPREYFRIHDPFVALGFAAAVTERLLLGTAICLVVERDPIVTAKEVASLDRLSGGRFLFGVGAGWNLEEMENHGTDPGRRFKLMRERVEAMRTIWTEDPAEYHGEFVNFDPIHSWPKPVQDPHPPILIGGGGPRVLDRVRAYGDEWFPIRAGGEDELVSRIESFEKPVTLSRAPNNPERIEVYERAGVHRCVYYLPPAGRDQVEPELDRIAGIARDYGRAGG
jgi:probable F420-dependent oxidoreductase